MPPDVYAAALERQQQQQRQQPQHLQAANSQQYSPPPALSSQQQQMPVQQSGAFMQTPNQGMSMTPMNPQGYVQSPLSAQQHFTAPLGTAASTAPSIEAEPPVPGTEDAAAAKANAKAAAKPSYSAAPVLRGAAATPAAESAPQPVCFFTLCAIPADFTVTPPVSAEAVGHEPLIIYTLDGWSTAVAWAAQCNTWLLM